MDSVSTHTTSFTALAWAVEHGLDYSRLAFARHLVRTGRISEDAPGLGESPLLPTDGSASCWQVTGRPVRG